MSHVLSKWNSQIWSYVMWLHAEGKKFLFAFMTARSRISKHSLPKGPKASRSDLKQARAQKKSQATSSKNAIPKVKARQVAKKSQATASKSVIPKGKARQAARKSLANSDPKKVVKLPAKSASKGSWLVIKGTSQKFVNGDCVSKKVVMNMAMKPGTGS